MVVPGSITLGPTLLDRAFRAGVLLQNARKHNFPSIRDLLAIFDPKKSTWCHVHGNNFAIPGGIIPKISKDLPGILTMLRAKFMPTGEIPEDITVTEQIKKTVNLVSLHTLYEGIIKLRVV